MRLCWGCSHVHSTSCSSARRASLTQACRSLLPILSFLVSLRPRPDPIGEVLLRDDLRYHRMKLLKVAQGGAKLMSFTFFDRIKFAIVLKPSNLVMSCRSPPSRMSKLQTWHPAAFAALESGLFGPQQTSTNPGLESSLLILTALESREARALRL